MVHLRKTLKLRMKTKTKKVFVGSDLTYKDFPISELSTEKLVSDQTENGK